MFPTVQFLFPYTTCQTATRSRAGSRPSGLAMAPGRRPGFLVLHPGGIDGLLSLTGKNSDYLYYPFV